jgi:hypothetical protein
MWRSRRSCPQPELGWMPRTGLCRPPSAPTGPASRAVPPDAFLARLVREAAPEEHMRVRARPCQRGAASALLTNMNLAAEFGVESGSVSSGNGLRQRRLRYSEGTRSGAGRDRA